MIQGIVGGTGDGKSLLATRYMTESLIHTNAYVVTNTPLVLGELYEYVSKRRSDDFPAFDLDNDVKVLKDEEVMEFYRYRSGGLVLPPSPDMEDGDDGTRRLPKPEFMAVMKQNFGRMLEKPEYQRPVHYFIDEAHNFFGSRDWKSNGRALLYYVSQHRHLHDEVYLITQVIDDVEKQFRDRILQTHQSRNQLRMRVGMFKAKPCFRVSVFNRLPGGNKRPMYSVEYDAKNLDADAVAKCYKTVGALGIHSTPEAKPNKAVFSYKMLWVVAIAAVIVVAAGLFGLPYLGSWIGKGVVKGTLLGAKAGTTATIPGKVINGEGLANSRLVNSGPSAVARNFGEQLMPGLPIGQEKIPWLVSVCREVVNGRERIHAFVEGAENELPERWISGYNLDDYPSGWVEAQGVRYYLKKSRVVALPMPLDSAVSLSETQKPEPHSAPAVNRMAGDNRSTIGEQ